MLFQAPFLLPSDFLLSFGYPGSRRFVALFWTATGDEACYDDGELAACGSCDNWLYLDLVRRPDVAAWLTAHDIRLGDSDVEARHWLLVDTLTLEVYAAFWMDARLWIIHQALPE